MFFHIDESGNSGNNLFDPNQPVLSYGVLSSRWDIDAHGTRERDELLRRLGAPALHANELADAGLRKIADELIELHNRFEFHFDYYFIHKRSFAVVTFFNAVFDAGINSAMKWDWYWTPLRFLLIEILEVILDDHMLQESWRLCLVPRARIARESDSIAGLLTRTLERLEDIAVDARAREILRDALLFGRRNPLEMDFGIYSPTALSPNTICFQFVLTAIAYRQKVHREKALRITVDRQTQFNGAQVRTYDVQSKIVAALRGSGNERERYLAHPFLEGAREDTATLISHFPEEKVTIAQSDQSFGLQLTDTYLWLMNRYMRGRDVPDQLMGILESVMSEGMIDGISVDAMVQRWAAFERQLPAFTNITPEVLAATQQSVDEHRNAVKGLGLE